MAKTSTESAIDDSEAQQELKRRARRRLIGATALALAAIVVLPMVMDHEPRPPAQDIQVRIPSQDGAGGIAARIMPGKAPTPLPPIAASKEVAASSSVAPPVAVARPEEKTEDKPEAKTESKPVVSAQHQEKAAAKPPVTKPMAKPVDEKKTESARAEAALSGAGTDAATQWVVQLGAYKEAGNVKLLVSKLKGMGVPSYTEHFDSPQGPRTRVRAGPFATKEAAVRAQAKAKVIGVNGPVAQK